ncbi:insulinase family protein [Persicimonas caeni]|uniref:Insulinase family protein n=1 Tax=Persicimonas caeni TaxID=2292766 RepID=A0A4Y6PRN7_PERCE|nr:pitrilysin family protein [Persicimonas caeni]QDG50981.1 insulinase family protein [Persicimonas caeni]QED32202.1 insulinase family protein [Persicimonas caeni]
MELTRYELDNGMKVLLHRAAAAPVVACNVWVGVGSADEEPEEAGLAHVHEHMLFKGTDNRQVGELAREVEAAGGHINAFTSFDQTCYYVVMSSRYFETGLDILADAIQNSSFDADELERELEVIQEEIKRGKDNPSREASLKLFETAYAEHPYRLPVIGTSESVDSFGRDDVLDFFHKHYVPENMALVLVGDFEIDEAKDLVEKYFGGFENGGYTPRERAPEPKQTEFRGWAAGDDINQAHLRVGFHIPHATHDDIPALDLLGAILGYGDSSHLFQTIQREQQLVNSIYSGAYTPKDAGLFMVSAQYQLPEEGRSDTDVLGAIMKEVFRFRDVRPSLVDLERARTIIESQEIYGKQTVQGLAMKVGRYQMVTGDPQYEQVYYEALAQVTPEDIRRVAREYLTPDNCTVVLSHPEMHGEVTVDELEETTRKAREASESEHVKERVELDEEGFARVKLPGGPTLVIQEDHSVETFSARALCLGGLRYENVDNNGINSLLSELVDKGTLNWSAEEIAHRVESMAGSLKGLAGRNSFGLSMSGLSQFFERSFELFAGCLLESTIPDDEFEREKRLQLEYIRSRRDKLGAVNYEQFCAGFFAPHPYSMPSDGSEASIEALSADDVRAYYKSLINPQDMVLVVVGDIDSELVEQLAERYFSGHDTGESLAPEIPEPGELNKAQLVVSDLEKEQAHIICGFQTPSLDHDDKYPLEVLYAILSGQGGRLFYELRDKQSLAYSVGARMVFGLDTSAFVITIGTSPEKIEQAVEGIVREVRKLHDGTITEDEVARAKRYLAGSHDIGLQKNSARSLSVGLDELYGLGYKRSLDYGERIEAIEVADVERVVDAYLDPERMLVSIVKPEACEVPDDLLTRVLEE